jgi:hypothetical protein
MSPNRTETLIEIHGFTNAKEGLEKAFYGLWTL